MRHYSTSSLAVPGCKSYRPPSNRGCCLRPSSSARASCRSETWLAHAERRPGDTLYRLDVLPELALGVSAWCQSELWYGDRKFHFLLRFAPSICVCFQAFVPSSSDSFSVFRPVDTALLHPPGLVCVAACQSCQSWPDNKNLCNRPLSFLPTDAFPSVWSRPSCGTLAGSCRVILMPCGGYATKATEVVGTCRDGQPRSCLSPGHGRSSVVQRHDTQAGCPRVKTPRLTL